jgi:phenylpropionate dioxygenase-like ring-hydroxylating dioxygenase large terminal subunit
MLKNFWYAIAFSTEVKDKPIRVTALGQELVIYRNTKGEPIVMSDLCIHRGGALSDGWTEGNCIVCPYHGWKFQEDGACVRIPSFPDPKMPIPRKARVDAYPTKEKYGFVWTFLGDLPENERPPIPPLAEFDDPRFRPIWGIFNWEVNFARAVENGMDIAHAPFVHAGSFGNPEKPEVELYEVEDVELGGLATVTLEPTPAKGIWSRLYPKKERQGVKTTAGFYMPNVSRLHVRLPIGNMIIFTSHVPVEDTITISKWVMLRDFFTQPFFDGDSYKRVIKIFKEDKPTVEAQRPELLPYDLGAELHVKADAVQIAYRRLLNKYQDMGYGIDMHKIQTEFSNKKAVVIPSPARREVPELAQAWVMKEVPMIGGNGQAAKAQKEGGD